MRLQPECRSLLWVFCDTCQSLNKDKRTKSFLCFSVTKSAGIAGSVTGHKNQVRLALLRYLNQSALVLITDKKTAANCRSLFPQVDLEKSICPEDTREMQMQSAVCAERDR